MAPPPAFNGRQRSNSGFGDVLGQGSNSTDLGMVPNLDLQPGAINPTGNMNQCMHPSPYKPYLLHTDVLKSLASPMLGSRPKTSTA